jgi:hypothetical protein
VKQLKYSSEKEVDSFQRLEDFKIENTQIALVRYFSVVNEPILGFQEEVEINFSPRQNEEAIISYMLKILDRLIVILFHCQERM